MARIVKNDMALKSNWSATVRRLQPVQKRVYSTAVELERRLLTPSEKSNLLGFSWSSFCNLPLQAKVAEVLATDMPWSR